MISNAELQYVQSYARYAPYPGDNYAYQVLEQLQKAYDIYNEKYENKIYSLILSNGEEFQFSILTKNLAHMLGIDFQNLISDPMENARYQVLGISPSKQTNSYEILSQILKHADDVIANDRKQKSYKILNYYKIMIKTLVFEKLSDFTNFNFGCINFDKNTYEEVNNISFTPSSTKFIFTPSDEALIPYFMIGLKLDNGTNIYIPETLFAPTDFYNFFRNQELVLPIQMLINDNQVLSKIVATPDEKLNILKLYKSIISMYETGSFINIFNDYETVLKESTMKAKTYQKSN